MPSLFCSVSRVTNGYGNFSPGTWPVHWFTHYPDTDSASGLGPFGVNKEIKGYGEHKHGKPCIGGTTVQGS